MNTNRERRVCSSRAFTIVTTIVSSETRGVVVWRPRIHAQRIPCKSWIGAGRYVREGEVIAAIDRCSGGDGSAVEGEELLVKPARRRSVPMGRAARANRSPLINHSVWYTIIRFSLVIDAHAPTGASVSPDPVRLVHLRCVISALIEL